VTNSSLDAVVSHAEKTISEEKSAKLTVLDIFRHKRLLINASVMWLAWYDIVALCIVII
jgi:hypothetical protein